MLKLAGIKQMPKADTFVEWLHRYGEVRMSEFTKSIVRRFEALKLLRVKRITLDIDATAILTDKADAQRTYLGLLKRYRHRKSRAAD